MNRYKYIDENKKHLHTLDGKPLSGTSTISGMMPKELTWWAAEMAAVTALEEGGHFPGIKKEYEDACSNPDTKSAKIKKMQEKYPLFKQARFAHYNRKKETAQAGNALHKELERYIKNKMNNVFAPHGYDEKIEPFCDWSNNNVKKWLGSEFHVWSEKLWCGGIVDGLALLNDDTIALIDFKSNPKAYLNMFVQAAGYVIQLEVNGMFDKDGNRICTCSYSERLVSAHEEDCVLWERPKINHIIIFPFGSTQLKPCFNEVPIPELKKGFECCNGIYRLQGLTGDNAKNRFINKRRK